MRKTILGILLSYAGVTLGLVVSLGMTSGCSNAEEPRGGRPASEKAASSRGGNKMSLTITSSAFTQGHPIPKKFTGEGTDVSPPLVLSIIHI